MAETELLLSTLKRSDWHVVQRWSEPFLPDQVRKRYPRLPAEVESFLEGLEACTNKDKTAWFLTHHDYAETRDGRFRWNEHELMSIDAAGGEHEERDRIGTFWDRHFPLMSSVHSGYDYLAVDLNSEDYGQIVHGDMSFPEEPSLVARSFSEFVSMFTETFRGKPKYPLSLFM